MNMNLSVQQMKQHPFRTMMRTLGQYIDDFFYHKREEIVIQLFWSRFSKANMDLPIEVRKERVISMLERAVNKEIGNGSQPCKDGDVH